MRYIVKEIESDGWICASCPSKDSAITEALSWSAKTGMSYSVHEQKEGAWLSDYMPCFTVRTEN